MTMNNKALNAYRNVHIASAVPYADGIQLIQMLFDGLIETLSASKAKSNEKILPRNAAFSIARQALFMGCRIRWTLKRAVTWRAT